MTRTSTFFHLCIWCLRVCSIAKVRLFLANLAFNRSTVYVKQSLVISRSVDRVMHKRVLRTLSIFATSTNQNRYTSVLVHTQQRCNDIKVKYETGCIYNASHCSKAVCRMIKEVKHFSHKI
jgi:hypothetical protein